MNLVFSRKVETAQFVFVRFPKMQWYTSFIAPNSIFIWLNASKLSRKWTKISINVPFAMLKFLNWMKAILRCNANLKNEKVLKNFKNNIINREYLKDIRA